MERLSGIAIVFIMVYTSIDVIVDTTNDSSESGGKQYFRSLSCRCRVKFNFLRIISLALSY